MNDKQIATTIYNQIGGRKAFYMMGAKNLAYDNNKLAFKIRGSRSINHIRVTLQADDLYTLEFLYLTVKTYKTVKKLTGLYNDQLKPVIEQETGLYLSL